MECTLRALMACTGDGGRVVAAEEGWQVGSRTDVIRNEMVREKVFERGRRGRSASRKLWKATCTKKKSRKAMSKEHNVYRYGIWLGDVLLASSIETRRA